MRGGVVDVFISYRRAQRSKVELIKDRLEALGLRVFFDVDGIDGGASFPSVIDANLRAAKAIVACWSPLYFQQRANPDWCMIESRFGLAQQKLVPIVIERFASDAPPVEMHNVNFFDLSDWRGEDQHEDWQRTLRTLSRRLGRNFARDMGKAQEPDVRRSSDLHAPISALATVRSPGTVWREPIPGLPQNACPEMVTLPAGKFLLGADDGGFTHSPSHEVRIDYSFALGRTCINFDQWNAARAAGAPLQEVPPLLHYFWLPLPEAEAYLAWINAAQNRVTRNPYRIPSEAEWAYALTGVFNQCFVHNELLGGVYNREWCADSWHESYRGAPSDGSAWVSPDTLRTTRTRNHRGYESQLSSAELRLAVTLT